MKVKQLHEQKRASQDFRGGRGEEAPPRCSPRKKRYFTQKFAYVCEKYAKLSFRIPDPRPKHIPYAQMEYAQPYAHIGENVIPHARDALAAQGRGGSRGLRPFRRGRARKRT